jgi:hypothetical protein
MRTPFRASLALTLALAAPVALALTACSSDTSGPEQPLALTAPNLSGWWDRTLVTAVRPGGVVDTVAFEPTQLYFWQSTNGRDSLRTVYRAGENRDQIALTSDSLTIGVGRPSPITLGATVTTQHLVVSYRPGLHDDVGDPAHPHDVVSLQYDRR